MNRYLGIVGLTVLTVAGCAALPEEGIVDSPPPRTNRTPVVHAEPALEPAEPPTRMVAHQQTGSSRAANALFSGPTPVETLLQYALGNNPGIAAARAKANAMVAKVPQVRSLDDPMLSSTVFLEEIQTAAGPQDLMLSLSQKFPWFGKLDARGQIACHDAQAAFAEMASVELTVMEQVRLAYLDLYFIHQALATYAELEPKLEDVVEVTRTRYETNAAKVGLESFLHAQVTLHKLQITLTELEQAKEKATARLAKAIHLPRDMQLDIEPQIDRTRLPHQVESLVAMIEGCHPQLRGRQHAIERDRWSIDLARRNYYPDVNVGFNPYTIGENGISPVANGRDAFALMAGVNLPVYKNKRNAALRKARWKTSQSSHQYEASWDALRADVETFYAQAVEHQRVLRILNEDILDKASDSFVFSVTGYQVDRIGFQQLIDSYENLLRFRLDYYLRVTSYEQAVAQLERAVGCVVAQWPLEHTTRADRAEVDGAATMQNRELPFPRDP